MNTPPTMDDVHQCAAHDAILGYAFDGWLAGQYEDREAFLISAVVSLSLSRQELLRQLVESKQREAPQSWYLRVSEHEKQGRPNNAQK